MHMHTSQLVVLYARFSVFRDVIPTIAAETTANAAPPHIHSD
jgi:hypothetical protein